MSFTPRTFSEILTDMIAYVQARTIVSDFNVGSVVRTILEAAALEDDEQYFQMVQLLDMFSIITASGEDLDRRLADFNITRQQSKAATGKVKIINTGLISDQVAVDAVSGSTSVRIFDSTGFPLTYPYTIRIAEGTSRSQDVSVTLLDTATNILTTSALSYDIEVGDRVSLVTGATSVPVNTGLTVQSPPSTLEVAKLYQTQEPAFIPAGNFYSNSIIVKASSAGSIGNTNVISQFVGNPPFSGASVVNVTPIAGGVDRETDADFRSRALGKIQSLSRGTPLALKAESVGVEDPVTGQRVVSSNLLEDFVEDEVIVYIDDGTGFVPDLITLARSTVASTALSGSITVTLTDGADFPSSGFVLFGTSELAEYVSKDSANVLRLATTLTNTQAGGTDTKFVDVLTNAETGQRRFNLQNFPLVRSSEFIYIKEPLSSTWTLLTRDVDYLLNRGTGEFRIIDTAGLTEDTEVVSHYGYYTNLIAEVQQVLEGNPDDSVSYPGVKAAGIFLSVEAPTLRRITVRAAISSDGNSSEQDLAPRIKAKIENYISSLKIGEDVIKNKLIDVAYEVEGLKDIVISLPSTNVVVLENELPVPFDANQNSLVTIL